MTEIESRLRDAARGIERPLDWALYARRAEELELVDVAYSIEGSPVGDLLIAATRDGLVRVAYLDGSGRDQVLAQLAAAVSPRVLEARRPLDECLRQLERYFAGRSRGFDLPLDWRLVGSFGRRVLEHTARIPYGKVTTYGQIARALGAAGAARAAGGALARNPIAIVVPCHRVVPGGGGVGGYAGGSERKRFLLSLEGAPAAG